VHWGEHALGGLAGTLALTLTTAAAQGLGLTRMSLPFLLGSMLTPDRDRAQVLGVVVHLVNGWLFSLAYVAVFHAVGAAAWWHGAALGGVHAALVLTLGMQLLPALHPRMGSPDERPDRTPLLEPPGFLALNYGVRTPVVVLIAHVAFGVTLAAFYDPAS
jgi:uncharacterized membrane protein YagU involved in acid resistance